MQIQLVDVVRAFASLLAGGAIGLAFGMIQQRALERNQKRQQNGNLNSGWAVMPGSTGRVAYLLVTLVLIQIVCPVFFVDGCQWWVSGGVVAGYGALLIRRLREQKSQAS
jgi:hypothetical protein